MSPRHRGRNAGGPSRRDTGRRRERPHPDDIPPEVIDALLEATPAERLEYARTGTLPGRAIAAPYPETLGGDTP